MKDEHPFWNFIKAKTNWPLMKIQLGVLAVITFFYWNLAVLYDQYVVDTILSKFDNTNYTGAVFFILIILYGLFVVRKQIRNNYQVTTNTLLLLIIVSFYYILAIRDAYTFASPFNNGLTYYTDILPLYSLYFLGLFIKNSISYFKKAREDAESKAIGFVTDEPLKDFLKDELDRVSYAKDIATKIMATDTIKSYAIGVNGTWGSGKTTFVNFIREELQYHINFIWIEFKPWDSLTKEDVINNFFRTIRKAVAPFSSDLSDNFKKYSQLLTNVSYKGLEFGLNSFTKGDNITEACEEINKILRFWDKRLIISIDDLDRLQKDEITQVINLIRNTADFDNTIYIVTYDKDYVSKAFEELSGNRSSSYLEKIFQVEINLPYIDSYVLREKLASKLEEYYPDEAIEEFKILRSPKYRNIFPIFDQYVTSIRDVNRFINLFVPKYSQIKGEVVLSEYFNLTLIQTKYPTILESVYKNRNTFFYRKDNVYYIQSDENNFKTFVENGDKYNPNELKVLFRSLKYVFHEAIYQVDSESLYIKENSSKFDTHKHPSIIYGYSFHRYFINIIPIYDITDKKLKYAIEADRPYEYLKTWIDQGQRQQLFRQLKKIESFSSSEDLKKFIISIFEISCYRASFEKQNDFYNLDDITNLFIKLNNIDLQNVSANKVFIGNTLRNITYITLSASLIKHIIQKLATNSFPISTNELVDIYKHLLDTYITQVQDVNEITLLLIRDSRFKIYGGIYTEARNSSFQNVIKAHLKNKGSKFLEDIFIDRSSGKIAFNILVAVFSNFDEIENFALENFQQQDVQNLINLIREHRKFNVDFGQ